MDVFKRLGKMKRKKKRGRGGFDLAGDGAAKDNGRVTPWEWVLWGAGWDLVEDSVVVEQ